jgi:hypothetical protein
MILKLRARLDKAPLSAVLLLADVRVRRAVVDEDADIVVAGWRRTRPAEDRLMSRRRQAAERLWLVDTIV